MKRLILIVAASAAIAGASTAQADETRVITAKQHAAMIVATWHCQDRVPQARTQNHYYPWTTHSQSFRAAQLEKWRVRLIGCKTFLTERARQWNWQVFPSWIIKLANCETSVDWFAEGSSRDGTFYSAFNIGRSRYDEAAHSVGMRGWHEGPGVPSPYEQAWTVIGYVRIHGDGFTGTCAGIAHSTWK